MKLACKALCTLLRICDLSTSKKKKWKVEGRVSRGLKDTDAPSSGDQESGGEVEGN